METTIIILLNCICFKIIYYLGQRSVKKEYEEKLSILRRYHGGDGSVSIKDVMRALGKE